MDIDEIRRENIKILEKEYGAKYLYESMGMSPTQFYNLREGAADSKTGKPRGMRKQTAWRFEEAGKKPRGWLDLPHTDEGIEKGNVAPGPEIRGKVPLISWVRAGDFAEAVDNFPSGETMDWVETTVQVKRHTFALRVDGDSMEPDFPSGTILIVEPEMDHRAGDFVIAKNGDGEATFKQLTKDGSEWYLKPKNDRYPIKPLGNCKIIGIVREAVRKFR